MKTSCAGAIRGLWDELNQGLFPWIDDNIGELDARHRLFRTVCEAVIRPREFDYAKWKGNGRPPASRLKIFKAFLLKAVLNVKDTKELVRIDPDQPPPPSPISVQGARTAEANMAELPVECEWGCKRDSQGKRMQWEGGKIHAAVTRDGVPIAVKYTSASLHDANAGKARRLAAAAQQRREAAEQSAARTRRLKEKKPPANDHDGRFMRGVAKLQGKDGWGFTQSAELRKRAAKLAAPDKSIRVDYEMGFWLEGAGISQKNYVLDIPPGTLDLGDGRTLVHPPLQIRPDDRIALVGANGLGKSSLLKHLLPQVLVPEERLLVIPQEISEEESRHIHTTVKNLDDAPLGRVMTLVSRLGSRPGRFLASTTPSPGEIRKILLARGVERGPHLIVMDEPTNHLDLPSIECLENALVDTPCAILLVSHDERFLSKLVRTRWELRPTSPTRIELTVVR